MAKRSELGRKALDLWNAPLDAGLPELCVATTFTFDAAFFERDCLGRFLAMEFDGAEGDSVAYLVEREEKLAAARVCVLVDRRHASDKQSLRWDVVPVIVPRAVQHAKLSLLVWENHVRVIVGSGNLTSHGYRSNLEVFGTLELSRKNGGARAEVSRAFDFLDGVLENAIGDPNGGPIWRVGTALDAARRRIARWPEAKADLPCTLVLGGPKRPVLKAVRDAWPSSSPPRDAWVASPFFDADPNDKMAAEALVNCLAKRGDRSVSFAVSGEWMPDGRIKLFAPQGLVKGAGSVDVEVLPVPLEQEGEPRPLHAKLLHLTNDDWQVTLIGSSNFTAAGLGLRGGGNLEANLVYFARVGTPEARAIDAIWPQTGDAVDLTSGALVWEPRFEADSLGLNEPCLPGAFQEALFAPAVPAVRITLGAALPSQWKVSIPRGEVVLASSSAGAGCHELPWANRPTPFVLEVTWAVDADRTATASWAVNVSDPAALPPPEELRALKLEDLLEVLASTRPIPDAVARIVERRNRQQATKDDLDPLKRVDTHAFLLQRTRRVAAALDRLRERLERPALTRDALEWRLRGAVGPVALADAIVRENAPDEAAFFLVELALALGRVDITHTAVGGLTRNDVELAIRTVIDEIETRLRPLGAATRQNALGGYLRAAMVEARS